MINSYDKLPLGKYLYIRELLKEDMDDLDLQTQILSIVNDMPLEAVLDLPVTEYSKLASEISFLTEKPVIKAKCPSKIKLGDNEYYVMKDINKINAAQFIDYNTYMKQDDPDGLIDRIMSIFIIPVGKKYNTDYDIEEVQEDIREYLPIQTALEACFFFRKKQTKYLRYMLTYLELMMKIMKVPVDKKKEMEKALQMLKELEALQRDLAG